MPLFSNDSRAAADAILRLGQMVSGPGLTDGLTRAQWTALRYLARANRFSRTPSAFAAFHGTSRGTASQTIKSLISGGYIAATRSPTDGRSTRLDLTAKGRSALVRDPAEDLVTAIDDLAPEQRSEAAAMLGRLIDRLAERRKSPAFGTCGDCRHRSDLAQDPDGARHCECRLAQTTLEQAETVQLCLHYQPARPHEAVK